MLPLSAKCWAVGLFLSIASLTPCLSQISMPLQSMKINSGFGNRIHPVTHLSDFHKGVDLHARNEPVFAFLSGKVSHTGFNPVLGKFVRIDHSGLESIYGHLSLIVVHPGQEVSSGQLLAVTGSTGRVTGEHLHFGLCMEGVFIDPILFIVQFYTASKINQTNFMESTAYLTLRQKLELLAMVEEIELNLDEAWVYGIDFADREESEDE